MHYIVIEIFTRDDGLFRSKRTLHANLAMHDSQQYRMDIDVFVSLNCLLSFADSLRECLAQSLFIRSNEEIHRLIQKTKPHYWSDKGFKGTVTNPTLTSLHGESLEIVLTVSSKNFFFAVLFSSLAAESFFQKALKS